jgi:hypothetical protein
LYEVMVLVSSFMAYLRPKDKPMLKLQNADDFHKSSRAGKCCVRIT